MLASVGLRDLDTFWCVKFFFTVNVYIYDYKSALNGPSCLVSFLPMKLALSVLLQPILYAKNSCHFWFYSKSPSIHFIRLLITREREGSFVGHVCVVQIGFGVCDRLHCEFTQKCDPVISLSTSRVPPAEGMTGQQVTTEVCLVLSS